MTSYDNQLIHCSGFAVIEIVGFVVTCMALTTCLHGMLIISVT